MRLITSTRRKFIGHASAAAAAACVPATRALAAQDGTPSLGALGASKGILFGTAYDSEVLAPSAFSDLYVWQARIFTSNNFMKFGSLRPTEKGADFALADSLVDFARARGILVRGHNLIWNDWTPDWLRMSSSRRVTYWLDRHIEETVAHYRGKLHSWDVVNEPFWPGHGNKEGYRSGPWYEALGKKYVIRALKRAHAADASAKLVINESGPEWEHYWGMDSGPVRKGLLRLIDEVRESGARLDAVGLQCHWMADFKFNPESFLAYLQELAARKLAIYLTELDISDAKIEGSVAERDAEVARRYHQILSTALKVPEVKIVQTWELSDNATWQREEPYLGPGGRLTRPLPFDEALQPKAAYEAIARAFSEAQR